LREEHTLRVFENSRPEKIFALERDKVTQHRTGGE
jgi:hypothetical protein